ncbi:sigma 54-interacting transcriptional regulator [Pendulispora brunnea]|uniref:Sigma 54-interacting transcriptional regulator n=1 Tax=Pendulispora brunnea TaxID=2905690 RepID=A0ABZ2K7Y1_9BACT
MDALTLKHLHAPPPTLSFRLVVAEGPDAGKVFRIDPNQPSRTLVGTSPTCVIRLADRHVSRRHLALDAAVNELVIQDLRSSNGTRVNGARITEGVLTGGEVIRIGNTVLRVEAGEQETPDALAERTSFGRALGVSFEMRKVFGLAERLAQANVPVAIEGETGTGKELLAECLHEQSARAAGPFVVFDGSIVGDRLADVMLFGCAANVVPGVAEARAGLFEQAHGGTLLIDEPAELSPEVQRKLVRAVERGAVQRIGADAALAVDVRIVTTSRADLDKAVDDGRLREDLFYRLVVARIELPPLRKRRDDVGFLAEHFWAALGEAGETIPPELLSRFEAHAWPGNVRELQNAVARHLATGELDPRKRPIETAPAAPASPEPNVLLEILEQDLPMAKARQQLLAEFERSYVARVLAKHGGNVTRAAAASGIAHRYFQSLKAKYTAK